MTKSLFLISMFAGSLLLWGCSFTTARRVPANNIALGQVAMVDGPEIMPVEVIEDSRCPANARCVWAGTARVKAIWLRPTGNEEVELTLGQATALADGALTMTSVLPKKPETGVVAKEEYRFSLRFQGGI